MSTTHSPITEADVVAWMIDQVRPMLVAKPDMGALEKALDEATQQCRRQALERLVQESADEDELLCPACGQKLNVHAYHRPRSLRTGVGNVQLASSLRFLPRVWQTLLSLRHCLGVAASRERLATVAGAMCADRLAWPHRPICRGFATVDRDRLGCQHDSSRNLPTRSTRPGVAQNRCGFDANSRRYRAVGLTSHRPFRALYTGYSD
jgi:hypothetical protein